MDHDTLDRLRQVYPAWRILVADHAPLVLSFLTLAFIQPNRRAIPAPGIAAHLDAYLDHLRETYPERYPRSARDYLEDWLHRIARIFASTIRNPGPTPSSTSPPPAATLSTWSEPSHALQSNPCTIGVTSTRTASRS
jgi:hypothetical protein